jgi:hypothetical protein
VAGGSGLRILTETVNSPSLAFQIRQLLRSFRRRAGTSSSRRGATLRAPDHMAFGEVVDAHYRFDEADVVISLDADFLGGLPGNVRYLHDYANRRRVTGNRTEMNRLYVIESTMTPTGGGRPSAAVAAERYRGFARALAAAVGVPRVEPTEAPPHWPPGWVDAVARDLERARGRSVVIAGDQQSRRGTRWPTPSTARSAMPVRRCLHGASGRGPGRSDAVAPRPGRRHERRHSADAGDARGNPVYNAPADLSFERALDRVPLRIHLARITTRRRSLSHWHLPQAHYLESWSDAWAEDGTVSIVQPLIAPLYGGRTAHEVIAALGKEPVARPTKWCASTGRQKVRLCSGTTWRRGGAGRSTTGSWPTPPVLRAPSRPAARCLRLSPRQDEGDIEIVFRPDSAVFDGRFANNGWLQELPRPISKLTWDNAVLMGPAMAQRLGIRNEDQVELQLHGRSVAGPAWILPGHAPGTA